jgi:hypothetical protein
VLERVQDARRLVAAVRQALQSASAEEAGRCASLLEQAITSLAGVRDGSREGVRAELDALKVELGILSQVAERGAEFYQGWARALGTAALGYQPTGEAAQLEAPGSVSLQG